MKLLFIRWKKGFFLWFGVGLFCFVFVKFGFSQFTDKILQLICEYLALLVFSLKVRMSLERFALETSNGEMEEGNTLVSNTEKHVVTWKKHQIHVSV